MSQYRGNPLINRRVSTKPEKHNVNKTKATRSSIEGDNEEKEQVLKSESLRHKVKLKSTTIAQVPSQSTKHLESSRHNIAVPAKSQTNKPQTSTTIRTGTGAIPKQRTVDSKVKSVRVQQSTSDPVKSIVKSRIVSRQAVLPSSSKKPNAVLNTYHNVTVVSPPPKIKHFKVAPVLNSNSSIKVPNNVVKDTTERAYVAHQTQRQSPNTILQKGINQNEYSDRKELKNVEKVNVEQRHDKPTIIKEPVSFEINFEQRKHVAKALQQTKSEPRVQTPESDNNDTQYSDDFDSYESDFEKDSSNSTTNTESSTSSTTPENDNITLDNTVLNKEKSDTELVSLHGNQNIATLKYQVASIVDKENKLDSGNYEINVNTKGKLYNLNNTANLCDQQQQICDSLEGFSLITSEQLELDSGISGSGNQISKESIKKHTDTPNDYCVEVFYEGYKEFYEKPFENLRSSNLLTKIQFDVLDCTLLDMKPMCYELFMQVYGNLYSKQQSTQTNSNEQENEVQTDFIPQTTKWTQHPSLNDNLCWGEVLEDNNTQTIGDCKFDISLKMLRDLTECKRNTDADDNFQLNTSDKLNNFKSFLRRASMLVTQCLTLNQQNDSILQLPNIENFSTFSEGFYCLKTNFINGLKVTQVFSNPRFNLVITVHESAPEAKHQHYNFVNLLMVWLCTDFETPIRLLSTWSEVSHIEISNGSPDIVVSALRDGNVALWDLNEMYPYTDSSSLDSYLASLPPSQTVTPNWQNPKIGKSSGLMDLGACIDIRSFQRDTMKFFHSNEYSYQDNQFVSLHDSGILTVWTLMKYSNKDYNVLLIESKSKKPKQFDEDFNIHEEISPWASCKLIQTAITNLRDYVEIDKHIPALFQENVDENDKMLMKLSGEKNESKCPIVHFNCLDVGLDSIYVCTNQQYIVICTKSLKSTRFRRISIPENYNLYPVFIKLLQNEHFLVVGFCNAALIILNCEYYNSVKSGKSMLDIKPKNNATAMAISARKHTNVSSTNTDTFTAKSCRMQNLILNERNPSNTENYFETIQTGMDATPSATSTSELKRKLFDINIRDHQLILPGLTPRTITRSLHMSVCYNEGQLFSVTNDMLRVYDFRLQKELEVTDHGNGSTATVAEKYLNITIAKITSEINYLILLNENNVVQVHKLKNCVP